MNLRDLHYVVAVADLKNFSQAAEQCNISQPTLSAQIKKLEEFLNVQIFERSNKKVMLTGVGEQIVSHARRILKEEQDIKTIAQSFDDPCAGPFKLGAFPTLSTYLFPSIVPALKERFSALKLILIEEKTDVLLTKLHQGDIDAAFIALPVNVDGLQTEALFEDPFCLAVPADHELAIASRVNLSILKDFRLLLLDEGHCLRDQALDVCALHGGGEDDEFRATGLETLRQMVKAGTGITLVPQIAVPEQEEADIRYIPFRDPVPKRTIGLVWRKTSARKVLMAELTQLLKNMYS